MKKLMAMMAFAALCSVAACGGGTSGGDSGGDSSGGDSGSSGFDMAQMTIDMYKNGTMKASYWCTVHADPKAGQYWETTSTSNYGGAETKMTMSWQIAKVDGSSAWVESDMGQGYILAYAVDLTKKMEDGANVTKAWIGKKDAKAEEIQVMEYKKPEGGTTGEAPKVDVTTEEVTLNAAGKDWACTLTTTKMEGSESKMWISKDGWFGGMIKMWSKMSAGESTTELTKFGEDGKPWLNWN